jgi:hypothetical protein
VNDVRRYSASLGPSFQHEFELDAVDDADGDKCRSRRAPSMRRREFCAANISDPRDRRHAGEGRSDGESCRDMDDASSTFAAAMRSALMKSSGS